MMPADAAQWRDGWHAQARIVPSPNQGPRPPGVAIDLVVVHSISLPPGQYGGGDIERLFTNRLDWDAHPYFDLIRGAEVSAHFVICRDAQLVQFVSVLDRAWHAGRSQWQGRSNCNDFSVGIELEGLEHTPFERTQYDALASLLCDLGAAWPIAQVIGHEHIAAGRKQDPGKAFDWPLLARLTGLPACHFPPATLSDSER